MMDKRSTYRLEEDISFLGKKINTAFIKNENDILKKKKKIFATQGLMTILNNVPNFRTIWSIF